MNGEAKESLPSSSDDAQRYRFRVRKRDNIARLETVNVEAKDLEGALEKLHHQGYIVISTEPLAERGLFDFLKRPGFPSTAEKPGGFRPFVTGAKRPRGVLALPIVTAQELITFAHQLSALLKAGVPLLRSLQIVQQGLKNMYFKSVFDGVILHVSQGFAFGYAVNQYPRVFSSIWRYLIEVGETSGNLPAVLEEISRYQEAAQRIKGKIISAFFYPSILSLFATAAVGFLLFNIIPKFEEIFKGLNADLPELTKVVMFVSHVLRERILIVLAMVAAVFAGLVVAGRTRGGRLVFDLMWLKIPLLGALFLQVSIVRFSRSLATLIRAGVAILQALEISTKLVGNAVLEEMLFDAREAVRGGLSLGNHLGTRALFPVFMTQLVAIGEETGQLEHFLDLIANYYEERIDTFLGRFAAALEPLLLIVVGCVIGVLVIAMFLPIIEISTAVH